MGFGEVNYAMREGEFLDWEAGGQFGKWFIPSYFYVNHQCAAKKYT